AAQVYALALSEVNGSNNTFANTYLPLVNQGVTAFATSVAGLTGTAESAIEAFFNNWHAFYAANPNAAPGISANLAAAASAFGDALGVALAATNPTALSIQGQVANALIDNAQGLYVSDVPITSLPQHTPLQGETVGLVGVTQADLQAHANDRLFA